MTDFVFIDSGLGGIPYMTALLKKSPDYSCVYVGDTANFPYGEKNHEQVTSCVVALVERIRKKFAPRVIVVACNTISVNALDVLRQTFPDINFVGTVPAIKLAARMSKKRRIGLLATKATCENPYNLELKRKFADDCVLVTRDDAHLISFIEHNAFTASHDDCLNAVRPAVDFFRDSGCDVIILGCTHFLNLSDVFAQACGDDITLADSVDGVVRHALEVRRADGGSLPHGTDGGEKIPPSLYLTGLSDTVWKSQYEAVCTRFGLRPMGIL